MSFTLEITNYSIEDIEFLKKGGDKAILKKLSILFKEIR